MPFTKVWNEYNNPFYTWWKVHNLFKFPYIHFRYGQITWFFGMPISKDKYNKIFDFRMSALGWKWKYEHVEHEWDPYVAITFFRKWQLLWVFNYVTKEDKDSGTRNIATWEAILDILYNNRPLRSVIKYHKWSYKLDNESVIIDIIDNLTSEGKAKML